MTEPVAVLCADQVARVRVNRPAVRNALDAAAIGRLTQIFRELSSDADIRCVVLEGQGQTFCGGADINYMRAGLDLTQAENVADAVRLGDMFAAIDGCAAPVIARVQGAALGGGAGLIAACDIAIAERDAVFGFTEAKLGIVPAVISPFVVRKIGPGHARALFSTAERFDAQRALRIGLIHEICLADELDRAVEDKVAELRSSAPQAARAAKQLARWVGTMAPDEARAWTAAEIATRRAGTEGQEGLRAFIERRKPAWR